MTLRYTIIAIWGVFFGVILGHWVAWKFTKGNRVIEQVVEDFIFAVILTVTLTLGHFAHGRIQ